FRDVYEMDIRRHRDSRTSLLRAASIRIRLRTHYKPKRSARDDLLVPQPCARQRLSIERRGLDVDILRSVVLGQYRENVPMILVGIQMEHRFADNWAADGIDAAVGIH